MGNNELLTKLCGDFRNHNVLYNFSRSWEKYANKNDVTVEDCDQIRKQWLENLTEEVCLLASEYL